jgi:hypothetical protein
MGGGGETTGGGGAGNAFLGVKTPATLKLAKLLTGLLVGYEVKEAGTIEAVLSSGKTKLGSAKKTVKAGKGTLKVKVSKKARRNAKKLRGKKLKLRTTFRPSSGGTAVVATKVIKIR